jgi:hypothetical protein
MPQARYSVVPGIDSPHVLHLIGEEGPLCRLPAAVGPVSGAFPTQPLEEALAEVRRRVGQWDRDGLLCLMCGATVGIGRVA